MTTLPSPATPQATLFLCGGRPGRVHRRLQQVGEMDGWLEEEVEEQPETTKTRTTEEEEKPKPERRGGVNVAP